MRSLLYHLPFLFIFFNVLFSSRLLISGFYYLISSFFCLLFIVISLGSLFHFSLFCSQASLPIFYALSPVLMHSCVFFISIFSFFPLYPAVVLVSTFTLFLLASICHFSSHVIYSNLFSIFSNFSIYIASSVLVCLYFASSFVLLCFVLTFHFFLHFGSFCPLLCILSFSFRRSCTLSDILTSL